MVNKLTHADRVLMHLYEHRTATDGHEPRVLTAPGMCEDLDVTRQTLQYPLEKLESDGLIEVMEDRGRNPKYFRLTRKGEEAASELLEDASDIQKLEETYRELVRKKLRLIDFKGIWPGRKVHPLPREDIHVKRRAAKLVDNQEAASPSGVYEFGEEGEFLVEMKDRSGGESGWERQQDLSLREHLRRHEHLVILGEPGAGKTTQARFLALVAARGGKKVERWFGTREALVPFLVTAADYVRFLKGHPRASFKEFLEVWLNPQDPRHPREEHAIDTDARTLLAHALDRGRAVILVDGLDEVPDVDDRKIIADRIEVFAREHQKNRLIVTSRTVSYRVQRSLGDPFETVELSPFNNEEIRAFAHRWCAAHEEAMGTYDPEDAGSREAEDLVEAIHEIPALLKLVRNPLLLTVTALIHRQGTTLPSHRVRLYERITETLVVTWPTFRAEQAGREPTDVEVNHARSILGPLALWMQAREAGGLVEEAIVRAFIRDHAEDRAARGEIDLDEIDGMIDFYLDQFRRERGILVERGQGLYGFQHRTLQEYFAAREVESWGDFEICEQVLDLVGLPEWEEVTRLLLGTIGVLGNRSATVTRIVEEVLQAEDELEPVLHKRLFWATGAVVDRIGIDPALHERIINDLVEVSLAHESLWPLGLEGALQSLAGAPGGAQVAAKLAERLNDEDPQTRQRALQGLAIVGNGNRIEEIRRLLQDDEAMVRRGAVGALGQLGETDYADEILPLLEDEDRMVRANAVGALGEMGATDYADEILPLLEDDDPMVRRSAVGALGWVGDSGHLEEILSLLEDDVFMVQRSAVGALSRMGDSGHLEEILSLLEDDQPTVRANAVRALGEMGATDYADKILSSLEDDDPMVRRSAVGALGWVGDSGYLEEILPLLEDDEPMVRANAVRALGEMGATDYADKIPPLLEDDQPIVRRSAVRALGRVGDPGYLEEILPLLEDDEPMVRANAVEALGQVGETDEADEILPLLEDEDAWVRANAVEALKRLGNETHFSRLLGVLEDDDASVVWPTIRALDELWVEMRREQLESREDWPPESP